MYAVTVGDQARTDVVLRCYVGADLNEEEPDLAECEAAALRVMAAADVPTPRLVAVDVGGERVGVPAVLMTRLPGRFAWDPRAVDRWLRRLAAVLPAVHDAAVSEDESVGQYFTTSSCRTSRRGGQRRRRCGSELSRCSMARSSNTTERSFTATSTQATCCGTAPM